MTTVRELAKEALTMCGAGAAKQIVDLAERYPQVEIWELAVGYMRRTPAHTSPLRQLEATLKSCAEQIGLVSAIGAAKRAKEPWIPLADRVLQDRQARKLRDVPIVLPDGGRSDGADWAAWDRQELAAATDELAEVLDSQPERRRAGEDRAAYAARIEPWRQRYREASLRWELANEAVSYSARNQTGGTR